MGVSVSLGGRYQCTYLDEEVREFDATRLAAVVIQRVAPDRQRTTLWRTLRQAVASFGKSPPPPPFVPLPAGWTAGSGMGGRREVLFSSERRLVCVAGRDYHLPDDGSTLALLVKLRRFSEQSRIDHLAWTAAVERDPLVRAFMEVDADH